MNVELLAVIFLIAGSVSNIGRMVLVSSMKKLYPHAYRSMGSPSIVLLGLDPSIPLGRAASLIPSKDLRRYKILRVAIHSAEVFLSGAAILLMIWALRSIS